MINFIQQGITTAKSSFKTAQQNNQLPLWIITAFAIYLPFEDLVIAWLPLSLTLKLAVRFAPEVLIYCTTLFVLYQKIRLGKKLQQTPIDATLIALFTAALISIAVNRAAIFGSLDNIRTLWRYLSVFYTVVNLNISEAQIINLLHILRTLGWIQSIIASIQFFLPHRLNMMLLGDNCQKAESKGASCGTFMDTAPLSAFLLVLITFTFSVIYTYNLTFLPKVQDLQSIGLLYFALFTSKKRAALLMGLIIPLFIFWFLKKKRYAFRLVWFGLLVGTMVILISPLS